MSKQDHLLKKVDPNLTIWLPIVIGILIMVSMLVFAFSGTAQEERWSQWSDIAIILLSSIFFLMASVELVILIGMIFLSKKISTKLIPIFSRAREFSNDSYQKILGFSDRSIFGFFQAKQIIAGINGVIAALIKRESN
jgi:hypothetical protein